VKCPPTGSPELKAHHDMLDALRREEYEHRMKDRPSRKRKESDAVIEQAPVGSVQKSFYERLRQEQKRFK